MSELWRLIRLPRGQEVRRGLAQACIAIGLVYLFASEGFSLLSPTYGRQNEIMPLPWFGLAFLICGCLLRFTRTKRSDFAGRMASAIVAILFALFSWTFFPTGPTGVAMYAVLALWAAGEAFHISDGG